MSRLHHQSATVQVVTISLFFAAVCLSCSATQAQDTTTKTPSSIEPDSIGSTRNVHRTDNLFFAGQFKQSDIQAIDDAKITRVITLRTDGEVDWDEQAAIEAAGIEFIKIPVRSPDSLTDDVFTRVRKLLADTNKKTLFHCGSANRVAGVWLPYRVLDQGVPIDQAVSEAKQIGLRTPFLLEKASDYIKRQQRSRTANSEQSVKPGINDQFKDPELNVEKMVKRFELESREIYVARNAIVEACDVAPGAIVADVGAGTGLFTRLFADKVGQQGWVYAVDIAPRLVKHIVAQASRTNIQNITGVICADDNIGLPPNSVDLVFICDVYHHFEFPKTSLASIHKALRTGGRLVVIDFRRIEGKTRPWLMQHVRAGKEVFRSEIQDAGFEFVAEKNIKPLTENYFLQFKKAN